MTLQLFISGELIKEATISKVRKETVIFGWKAEYKERIRTEPWFICLSVESKVKDIEVKLTA